MLVYIIKFVYDVEIAGNTRDYSSIIGYNRCHFDVIFDQISDNEDDNLLICVITLI